MFGQVVSAKFTEQTSHTISLFDFLREEDDAPWIVSQFLPTVWSLSTTQALSVPQMSPAGGCGHGAPMVSTSWCWSQLVSTSHQCCHQWVTVVLWLNRPPLSIYKYLIGWSVVWARAYCHAIVLQSSHSTGLKSVGCVHGTLLNLTIAWSIADSRQTLDEITTSCKTCFHDWTSCKSFMNLFVSNWWCPIISTEVTISDIQSPLQSLYFISCSWYKTNQHLYSAIYILTDVWSLVM